MKSLLEEAPAVTQDWVLTYGDLMSLLLTFFIMLVSMSEIKQGDKYQGVADSLQQKFGNGSNGNGLLRDGTRRRDPKLAGPISANFAQRQRLLQHLASEAESQTPALAARPNEIDNHSLSESNRQLK